MKFFNASAICVGVPAAFDGRVSEGGEDTFGGDGIATFEDEGAVDDGWGLDWVGQCFFLSWTVKRLLKYLEECLEFVK
jgi:hypothetical protein